MNEPNPTGIKLSNEQLEESFRQGYWAHAIEYGLQYYVAGRFATAHRFMPISANLLHHAVELLLKACLAYDDPVEKISEYGHPKKGYGHDLLRLWEEFKKRHPEPVPSEFDGIIGGLHHFENIRYPETLIRNGATVTIGVFEVDTPIRVNGAVPTDTYTLMLPQIDRLVRLLVEASHGNPAVFVAPLADDTVGRRYYDMSWETFLGGSVRRSAAPAE